MTSTGLMTGQTYFRGITVPQRPPAMKRILTKAYFNLLGYLCYVYFSPAGQQYSPVSVEISPEIPSLPLFFIL